MLHFQGGLFSGISLVHVNQRMDQRRHHQSERREGTNEFDIIQIACLVLSCFSDCMSSPMQDEVDLGVMDHHNTTKHNPEHKHEHEKSEAFVPTPIQLSSASAEDADVDVDEKNVAHVTTPEGTPTVNLPYRYLQKKGTGCVLMTHGLGAKNPKVKTHENDEWLNDVIIPAVESTDSFDYCAYTARGHGHSTGWESTGDVDGDQFTWKRLGYDMLGVATDLGISSFVSAGSSQGSATALFAAMYNPSKVKAVIMIRPPSAWNRKPEKKLESAETCKKRHPHELNYLCLKGTAYSDFPPIGDESYSSVKQKVLILTVEGDTAHPVSTAQKLNNLLINSSLHIAISQEDAVRDWPSVIQAFLADL